MNCQIIILAAGNGSRMGTELPKVMHEVGGKPMIDRVITNARQITNEIILVHSPQLEEYISHYKDICQFALQSKPLGTAHAVYTALDLVDDNKIILVLYGDNPLITSNIINALLNHLVTTNSAIATLCFKRDNPNEYGRIVTTEAGEFLKIVEFKDANIKEQSINICNSGIMAFGKNILKKYLSAVLSENAQNNRELYLTALVKFAKDHGEKVTYLLTPNHDLVVGVNTKQELEEANNTIAKLTKNTNII